MMDGCDMCGVERSSYLKELASYLQDPVLTRITGNL